MLGAPHPPCPSCFTPVPHDHRFCAACGTPGAGTELAAARPLCPPPFAGRARLTVLRGGGREGTSFVLAEDHVTIGRNAGVSLDDPYLSEHHATFTYLDGALYVADAGSLNGIFRRTLDAASITFGDEFRAGDHLFVLDPPPVSREDETVLVTRVRPAGFAVTEVLNGGARGRTAVAFGTQLTIGRAGTDLRFADDEFLDAQHCAVEMGQGGLFLLDNHTTNGTYVRLKEAQQLYDADCLMLGTTVLRVDWPG
jgi:pSer/pThr/pTyr-binding forkhead associated (FHA) protein